MKKIVLFLPILLMFQFAFAQEQITEDKKIKVVKITDWNKLRRPGFFESEPGYGMNTPSSGIWYWGINIAHSHNTAREGTDVPYYYGGQIIFTVQAMASVAPDVFIRSTNVNGEGMWAKVLHSKGNHAIDGKLTAKEIEIKINTGADFVFSPNYKLKPLSEVEAFVNENKHLPEIPSEKQMQENGLNLNEMQIKLLQKIEELTLYVIGQNKEVEKLKTENQKMKEEIQILKQK